MGPPKTAQELIQTRVLQSEEGTSVYLWQLLLNLFHFCGLVVVVVVVVGGVVANWQNHGRL